MSKVIGLGGVFIEASDPKSLADWYQRHLGIDFNGNIYMLISLLPIKRGWNGKKMKVLKIVGDPIDEEYWKFGWILDLEGKVELF